MEVDRRVFLATLGVGALELMSPEDKAEALEHYMEEKLDAEIAARDGTEPVLYMPDGEAIALTELQQENPRPPRGVAGGASRRRRGGALAGAPRRASGSQGVHPCLSNLLRR